VPWVRAKQPRAKSSGFRVAAGIIGIVLGVWLLVPSIAGFQNTGGVVFMAFLILLAALANITAGILLLVNQRSRTNGAPATSLSAAGSALLLGFIGVAVEYYGAALFVTSLLLAAPVLILLGIGLSREKRGALPLPSLQKPRTGRRCAASVLRRDYSRTLSRPDPRGADSQQGA
jgi:hypothetical protein